MISLILTLAIIGFLVWVVVTFIPMPEPIKRVIVVIAVVLLVLYVLRLLGVDVPLR